MRKNNTCVIWLLLLNLAAFSHAAASWRTIESAGFHQSREETTLAACGGNDICLLGGRNLKQTPILNTKTLEWYKGPQPPQEIHHFQGVTGPDGCAWVLGAWTGRFPNEVAVPEIYRYCAVAGKWSVFGQMSRPRGGGGAVYYGGYFYVVSGNVGGHKASANVVPWFDRYDPKTKTWTQLPDLPHPRDHVNVAVVNNKLYVVGGRDSGGANFPEFFELTESKVDVFDFNTNSWSTLSKEFPSPRAGSPVVVRNGEIWIAGGEGSGKAWVEVDVLSKSKFRVGPPMIHPRHGFGMCSCNGVIYVAGGAGVQGGGNSQTMLDAFFDGYSPQPCTVPVTWTPSSSGTFTVTPKPSKFVQGPVEKPSSSQIPVQQTPKPSQSSVQMTPVPSQAPVQKSAKPSISPSSSVIPPSQSAIPLKPSPSSSASFIPPSAKSTASSPVSVESQKPTKTAPSKESETTQSTNPLPSVSVSKPTNIPPTKGNSKENTPNSTEEAFMEPEISGDEEIPGFPEQASPEATRANTDGEIPGFPEYADEIPEGSDEGDTSTGAACFPGHSTVQLHDGSMKTMEQLEIGDKVLVSHPDTYSEVYFFSHKHKDQVSNFVSLTTTSGHSLQLSSQHLVYVNDELIEAQYVQVGDNLRIAHENDVQSVSSVTRTTSKGLFNPHTIHGDIIVNNVAASTLTRAVHPLVSRALLKPFAAIYKAIGPHPVARVVNRQVLRAFNRFIW